jgi:hypothetical protein
MGTGGSFPGGKAAGAWSWPLTRTSSWRSVALVKCRDSFTFTSSHFLHRKFLLSAFTFLLKTMRFNNMKMLFKQVFHCFWVFCCETKRRVHETIHITVWKCYLQADRFSFPTTNDSVQITLFTMTCAVSLAYIPKVDLCDLRLVCVSPLSTFQCLNQYVWKLLCTSWQLSPYQRRTS